MDIKLIMIALKTIVIKPPVLISGCPKATLMNLSLGFIIYIMCEFSLIGIIIALAFISITQILIVKRTLSNPYFTAIHLARIKSLDLKARNEDFKGEIYVP